MWPLALAWAILQRNRDRRGAGGHVHWPSHIEFASPSKESTCYKCSQAHLSPSNTDVAGSKHTHKSLNLYSYWLCVTIGAMNHFHIPARRRPKGYLHKLIRTLLLLCDQLKVSLMDTSTATKPGIQKCGQDSFTSNHEIEVLFLWDSRQSEGECE